jgi:TolB protein
MPEGAVRWAAAVGVIALVTLLLVGATASQAGVARRTGMIAFVRSPTGFVSPDLSLFVIRADGSGLRSLTPADSDVASYEWSPDGSRIAYLDSRGALWLVRPDGTGRELLAASSPSRFPWKLSWSPDGKAIAVLVRDPAAGPPRCANCFSDLRISVIPTDGRRPRRLPSGDAFDPAWSPRGDEIAYATPFGVIMAVRSDGRGRPRVVTRGTPGCFGPAWSADGERLASACGDNHGRYAYIDVVNANGSSRRRLTKHAYNEFGFAWSPDGLSILYGRKNREGIYVIGVDGRKDHKVTSDSPAQIIWGALTWAADGRAIAYTTDRTGGGDLYVIGADGRDKLQLTRSLDADVDPSWSPG